MQLPIQRFERVDVLKSIGYGIIIDVVIMFGLWPAAGEPFPTIGQALLTVMGGIGIGFFLVFLSKVRKRRKSRSS